MANRHERRRATKLSCMEMTLREFAALPSMCAWAGCHKAADDPCSSGWSNMLLYKGRTELNFIDINQQLVARDCVLCPEHARYLDEHVLIDIGGRLRFTAGVA